MQEQPDKQFTLCVIEAVRSQEKIDRGHVKQIGGVLSPGETDCVDFGHLVMAACVDPALAAVGKMFSIAECHLGSQHGRQYPGQGCTRSQLWTGQRITIHLDGKASFSHIYLPKSIF